jgi:hypothetical protein
MRGYFVAATLVVVSLGAAWMLRYDTKPTPTGGAVILDRWTGQVKTCGAVECFTLSR